MPSPTLLFPYMRWAHTEAFRSPYCLTQSGMPVPPTDWLDPIEPEQVLSWPAMEALPALERRLAELFGVDPARVLVTVGASGAMALCAQAWFGGDTVAHETPAYEPLRVLPTLAGGRPVPVERRFEDGWRLTPEALRAALAGSRPGHLFLTNPHNPTGVQLSAPEVRALADVCAEHGGVLVSCDVYGEFAPTTDQRVHAAVLAPNGVSIGSLTKAYGLGPLRIGWILLGEGLVEQRARLVDRAYLTWVDPPSASLVAARQALDALPALLQPLRRVEHESRPLLLEWLRDTPGVHAVEPPYGIFAFPRLDGVPDTRAFAEWLVRDQQVDVVPGEHFGLAGHLRLGCGLPAATLAEGLRRLAVGHARWVEAGGRPA